MCFRSGKETSWSYEKNKKYDNMDLIRSIKTGNIRDASFSKRDLLQKLFYDVRDRFRAYNRRKK